MSFIGGARRGIKNDRDMRHGPSFFYSWGTPQACPYIFLTDATMWILKMKNDIHNTDNKRINKK
jgi:hypothetical protein